MKPERWARVKTVAADAMELPADERSAFLDRTCGADDALRREVEGLLAQADGGDSLPGARNAVATASRSVASAREAEQRATLESAIGNQYEILKSLGRGGMAEVYLARERALERFVAIKVLRQDVAAGASGRERFRREARVAAQLSHPGIVPLHSFGDVGEGALWYFVMGYARGETLAERLRLEGRIPWVEAHRILTELTDALGYAHRQGVIHRDIKPANVLLDDQSGRTMLADFGVAKVLSGGDSLTAPGMVVGTPDYMSPEQVEGLPDVDGRSDIYSLGAVAYKMLSGREPFHGASARDQMMSRLVDAPTPLKTVAPTVPDSIAVVVMKCLERDRNLRWRDAADLKDALARAGATASETLPETLRDLPSFGAYAVLWALAWSGFALLSDRAPSERVLLILIAVLVPFGLALHVWNVGRHGLGPSELARVAAWPPEWWGMWWPRALRRPNDLWARLPLAARAVRITLSAFFVFVPGLIIARQWVTRSGGTMDLESVLAAELTVVLITGAIVGAALAWTRRRNLSGGEAVRLLFGATIAAPWWDSPAMARILAPTSGGVRPPERDMATDHLRAIRELTALFPPTAAAMAREAEESAARAARVVDQLDRELATLARDTNAAEIDRLSAQLASLGDAATSDNPERRELHELVTHQLELVRRLRARHEELARRRVRGLDLLHGLWSQLLAARDAAQSGTEAPAFEQVRATCAELEKLS